jgi:flagellar assembly protein FliH
MATRSTSRRPQFLARCASPQTVKAASFRHAAVPGGQQARSLGTPFESFTPPASEPTEAPVAGAEADASRTAAEERLRAEIAERLAAAIELLRSTAGRLAAEARSDALEIGFLVARRILESELTANREPLVALVRSAIRRLGEARQIVVRLCPQDAVAIDALLAERSSTAVSSVATAQIEVIADAALGRGDCLVEGDLGTVDGRIATRLEELRRALADEALEVES